MSSPILPVGAYTYSQGLEWAVETGAVNSEASALAWIGDCLEFGSARFEAVYLAHMMAPGRREDVRRLVELDAEFIASRETAELRAETLQMGYSLARCWRIWRIFRRSIWLQFHRPSFPLAWSCAAAAWAIPAQDAVAGYLWAWTENQVMAAVKAVPFGQTAGQRLLLQLGAPPGGSRRRSVAHSDRADLQLICRRFRSPAAATKPNTRGCSDHDPAFPIHCASASAVRSAPARPR